MKTSVAKIIFGMAASLCVHGYGVEPSPSARPAELAFPEVVKYEVGPGPVQILNLFPDRGFADPHVMIVSNRLYLACGHDKSWDETATWTMDRWEVWSTSDLREWRHETTIRPTDTYIGDQPHCWAGDFAAKNGKYYWYFSNLNIDTGVTVADKPGGPYRDALGSPLLPKGIVPVHPYDPEIYEEDGKFTIFFGAGTYYAATLSDDMISLADQPQAIKVTTADGKIKYTDDKSCVFKRAGKYYLVFGAQYCMSDQLRGPYEYKGKFPTGGHGSVFQWEGQWYAIQEFHDISMFYRGIMLKPLAFKADMTVSLEGDTDYHGGGRIWEFSRSRQGWHAISGTTLEWDTSGSIQGEISGEAVIESAMWCTAPMGGSKVLRLALRNRSEATKAKITLATFSPKPGFWKNHEAVDWEREASVVIDLKPNDPDFTQYEVDVSHLAGLREMLKQVRIEPAVGAKTGSWELASLVLAPMRSP